ncbi:hypothetical protein HYX17_03995 [Candidatus Woesearchaeota archaeon]|nr:hypothetical protein [Candidatus Woesearchaeota archaeon]
MTKIKSVKRKIQSLENHEDLWRVKFRDVSEKVLGYSWEISKRLEDVIPKGYEFGGLSFGKYGHGEKYALFVHLRSVDKDPKKVRYNDFSILNEGIIRVLRNTGEELGIPVVYGHRPSIPSVKLLI